MRPGSLSHALQDREEEDTMKPGNFKVMLQEKDIAPYLYGKASHIMSSEEKGGWFGSNDLNALKAELRKLPFDCRMFGVQLRVLKSKLDLKVGNYLLDLQADSKVIQKTIIQITEIAEDYFRFKIVWPAADAGFKGFDQLASLFKEPLDYHGSLYLSYKGPLPKEPKKTFYSEASEKLSELKILTECWAMVSNNKFLSDEIWSYDTLMDF